MTNITLVGYGVDTLLLNIRYTDKHGQPVKQELLEIKQKSGKTWFYDLRRKGVEGVHGGTWDGESDVWWVEFRFKWVFLHDLTTPIEDA